MLSRALVLFSVLLSSVVAQDYAYYKPVTYTVESIGDLKRFDDSEIALLEKLNRRDRRHLRRAEQIVVPSRFDLPEEAYSPLPRYYAWAGNKPKVIVFYKPAQVFAAYHYGLLVRWGPFSSGRKSRRTPTGLFHLNWKSEGRTSTIDDNWYMPWYWNFDNKEGLAIHEYKVPGRPASHGCVRLLERDAKWLYDWGEGWVLSEDGQQVIEAGTPVFLAGQYDFSSGPPWMSEEWWSNLPITLPIPDKQPEDRLLSLR